MLARNGLMSSCVHQPLPPFPQKGLRGFSLVEVMVAVAILALIGGTVFMAMCRLHRNAADNRNYASAQIILRNAIDQALTRGWDDANYPDGILSPTNSDNTLPYDTDPGVKYESGLLAYLYPGSWVQWNPFSASDTWSVADTVPIYSDQMDPSRNVTGRLYRKVQFVTGMNSLLWVTMRLDYTYDGKEHSQQMFTIRSAD